MTETETEITDTQPEVEPAVEETPDVFREYFVEELPELADEFDNMSANARVKALKLRMQEKMRVAEAAAAPSTDSATEMRQSASSAFGALKLGLSDIESVLTEVDDPDGNIKKAFEILINRQNAILEASNQVWNEQDGKFEKLSLPQTLKGQVSDVEGAEECDIPRAMKLLASGDVKSEVAALRLAALERSTATGNPQSATDAAKRKAAALKAGKADVDGLKPGESVDTGWPTSPQDWIEKYKRDEARQQAGGK